MPERFVMTKKAKERLGACSSPIQRHLSLAIDFFLDGHGEIWDNYNLNFNGLDYPIYEILSQGVIFILIEVEIDCVWLASFYVLFDAQDFRDLYV